MYYEYKESSRYFVRIKQKGFIISYMEIILESKWEF